MVKRLVLLALAAALLGGCASTSILHQWQAAEPGPAFRKLLVVGLLGNADVRRVFEEEMVKALAAVGVAGVSSYTLAPDEGPPAQEKLAAALARTASDGVLSTRIVKVDQEVELLPLGPVYYGPPYGFYGRPGAPWAPVYNYPPAAIVRDVVYADTRLYRGAGEKLIWAAATETYAPTEPRAESAAFAKLILRELARKGLL